MKIIWTLRYDREVVSYLYSMRNSPIASELREAIQSLQFKDDPTEGCRLAVGWDDRYEFEQSGHWIGFELVVMDKGIRVLYVTTIS
ncbi:MAG: hypothetical protein AAF702_43870 [Chloroflexota bacterium]